MIKKSTVLLVIFLTFQFLCFSHDNKKHDEYFIKILFGDNILLNKKEQEKITLLCYATHIALDQYNGSYEKELNYLKSKRIKTIPSIDSIDFTYNSFHQRYTHRGWTFSYVNDKGNWPLRKQLLLDTTKKIFSFNSKEQHDAFTALIYYIHILGDHDGDKISTAMDRIALGGRNDKLDILSELSNLYLPKLFKNQRKEVNFLCQRLQRINQKCSTLLKRKETGYDDRNVKRDVKDLSEEEYLVYQKYAKDTLKILIEEIPKLLQNEKWFSKEFPSS